MDFMLYLAMNLKGQMPVAGGLETIAILLQKDGDVMPWSLMDDETKPLPEPQWLLGELLQTPPPDGSNCRQSLEHHKCVSFRSCMRHGCTRLRVLPNTWPCGCMVATFISKDV